VSDDEAKVERVARAIRDALDGDGRMSYVSGADRLDDVVIDGQADLLRVARAAIAAMREEPS
jgi:hypothetical protein